MPLPTRFLSLVAPSFGPMLFSLRGRELTEKEEAAAALNLRSEIPTVVADVANAAEQRAKAAMCQQEGSEIDFDVYDQ